MAKENGKKAGATIGEAVGLASQMQLEESEKKKAFAESECIRLCGVLDGKQAELDAQIAKTAEAEGKIKAAEDQVAAATRKCAVLSHGCCGSCDEARHVAAGLVPPSKRNEDREV